MSYGNAYIDQYRKTAVNSASPLQLVIMLYDGALRFLHAGKEAMIRKDLYGQNTNLQKAQRIVAELMSSLNMDQGGEVAQNLLALYTFVYNRLIEANINDKPDYIDQCDKILRDLRESWVQIEAEQRQPAMESVGSIQNAA